MFKIHSQIHKEICDVLRTKSKKKIENQTSKLMLTLWQLQVGGDIGLAFRKFDEQDLVGELDGQTLTSQTHSQHSDTKGREKSMYWQSALDGTLLT
jgi:hypothetical protein